MKSYTDINQSKKLTAILPFGSADMYYPNEGTLPKFGVALSISKNIPCWSLAALISVLPSATLDSSDDHHYRVHCNERFTDWYDNPIDCCVAMIDRLHEQMIYDFNNK